jgi:hypothetical protein
MQMRKTRAIVVAMTILTAMVVATLRAPAQLAAPAPAARVGEPEKVCQLTGEIDWVTGRPTAARTLTNFGMDAADLGYPVEYNGMLVLLFGDSWPSLQGLKGSEGENPPNDAVGESTRVDLPNAETCLGMTVLSRSEDGRKVFNPSTITGPVKVKQGWFNVPTGGVSVNYSLYAFFWTNHCRMPAKLQPNPDHPLALPAPTTECPETPESNSIGNGVMARSDDGGSTFSDVVAMPKGFVYSTAVNSKNLPGLPDGQNLGVFIYGEPRYRASVPYLAYAPLASIADPATWRFFAGLTPQGQPKWVSLAEWKPGPDKQIFTPAFPSGNDVGEFSITWNAPLRMWLLIYGGVSVRVAAAPWGPWSEPTEILGPADRIGCKLIMTVEGCGNRRNYWPKTANGTFVPGGFYAPYVLNRYTRAGGNPRSATIYWTLSTWNPYQVYIMKTTIELPLQAAPFRPIGLPRLAEPPMPHGEPPVERPQMK